jgi:hypothetical protein
MTMTRLLLCAATILALTASANAQRESGHTRPASFGDIIQSCRPDQGCAWSANPKIIAALKKRYPSADDTADGIWVIDHFENSKHRFYEVAFTTTHWNMVCRFTINPIKFSKCRTRHA